MSLIKVNQISKDPWIWIAKNFLLDEECKHLIELASGKLRPSTVYDSGEGVIKKAVRSSTNTFLRIHQDDIVTKIENRIEELVNIPTEFGEGLQLLNYQVGQHYVPHHDFFESIPGNDGQRITTVCLYLNTVEKGGSTFFPDIGLEVWPIKGTALVFHNINPVTGNLEWKTRHEAQPVIKGEKWMATKWYRNLPFKNE